MLGLIPNLGPWELIIILAIVLVIFGPGKLPQVGKALGGSIREFRRASKGEEVAEKTEEPDK